MTTKGVLVMQPEKFPFKSLALAGIPLVVSTPEEAALALCEMAKSPRITQGCSFHLVNAYTIALASGDARYADLLRTSTANFPDGKPLTWWKLGTSHRLHQIRGPKLFEDVMDLGRGKAVKHYLLGGSPETLNLLESNLRRRYPGVEIVGAFSPPFREMTEEEVQLQDAAILGTSAEIVWVGLGTPKQDWEVTRLASNLPVLSVAVGAAFDFSAGTKRNAPHWMANLSLEWLHRLISEPRRLWKRYLLGNIVFLWAVFRHRSSANLTSGDRLDQARH